MKLKRFFASLLLTGVCMGALADGPFRNHRFSSFQALPAAQSGDVVFIGNSITNMFNWWEGFGSVQKIHGRGNSGGVTQEVLDNLESMIAGQPCKVFLMIGTNDLGTAGINDPARTAMQIKTIITRIRKESPATEVYYQTILPSGQRDKQKILDTNAAVKAWIEGEGAALGKVAYVDLYAQLNNGSGVLNTANNGTNSDSYDNLHLTNRGYYKWHQKIQEYMPEDCQSVLTDAPALGSGLGNSPGMRSTYFGALPVKNTDVLIIGDEMIHGGEWHELLASPDFKDRGNGWGYPGVNIANMTAELNTIFSGNTDQGVTKVAPRAVCLYAGVADCNNNSFNADNVKAAYKNLVDGVLEKDGGAPLFLMTLLPHNNTAYNSNAKTLNAYMAELAAANDKVHVIDLYAATGGDSRTAEYFMEGNYVTGVGYAQLANTMADALNPVLKTSYSAISLGEARANVARFNTRKAIGEPLNNYVAIDQYKGTGLGQYTETTVSTYKTAVEPAFTALQALNPTSSVDFGAAMTTLKQNINLPTEELLNGKEWAIVAQRNGVYVSSNGVGQGVTGKAANNQYYSRWTISKRSDGSWNFCNKADDSYLVPASGSTNQLVTSATEPSSGWSFSYSDVLGTYIINCGSIQLHNLGQTENKIANWGGGEKRNDEGCLFTLVEIEGEPDVLPITGNPHAGVSTLEDGHRYTITNRQPAGESYGFYMMSGEGLKIAANGVLPYESYGDAALFTAVQKDSKWAFCNEATGYYLVWKGDDSGTNSNKGYLDSYNSTYCDFSLTASSNCTPGFILEGKRDNGSSGAFVLATNGGLSKWSGNSERYGTGFSNVFTIAEVTEETSAEGTAVSLSFKNGSFGGSGTYCSSWTSSGTPAVKVEAYNKTNLVNNLPCAQASADAFIVYTGNRNAAGTSNVTPYISYLRVSAPTGYYVTGYSFDVASHDLTATGSVTVTTPKGSSYTITSTSASQSEKYTFADTEHTYFDLNLTGENKGVKFTNFIVYVKEVPGEPAIEPYSISSTTGSLYNKDNGTTGNYFATWKSTQAPQLLFGCGVNNMRYSSTNLELMTGTSSKSTYTLTAPAGYVITGYTFNYANNNHDTALTLTHNGDLKQTSRTAKSISVEDVELSSASFTLEGDNGKGLVLTDFVVTIEPFVVKPPVVSTEDDVKWYYIVNACSKTYCHDKVMYYDPDDDRMKFANKTFDARYIWSFWRGDNGKLAIKNYKGEYLGTAGNVKGGTSAFGKSDTPNYIYSIDEAFDYLTIGDGGVPLHAQESGSIIVRWDASADGASLWRFEKADVSHADAAISTTLVQQGKVSTGRGNKHVPIIRSTMKVSGLEGDVTFSGVKGKVTGTNLADITKVQAYFATDNRELHVADDRMEWRNSNAQLYGTAVAIDADGQFVITGANKTLAPGSYYLWITLDIADAAVEGNNVDAQILSYTVDGSDVAEENGNPQYEAVIFLSEGTVLMAGDGKFKSKYFRIPAITTTADGKRLVTLTDDRLNHNGDLPNHVYITAQYSDDNGQTWSEPKIVAGEEATGGNYAHGDAQIITNRVNGDIVGIMTCATNGQGFWGSTPERPQTWKTIISHDGGETWSVPVDHTTELYAAGSPNPGWQGGFSGSGAGLQKRDGTLVSPFVNRDENGNRQFALFESVDAGQTWHVAGKPCMIGAADEPKVLECNNGDLAISVRATGRNFHNVTSDNGETWNLPVDTRFTTGISGNACDGEYMVWCSTLDGNERNIAFQTVPNNNNRRNVSIALSVDEGDTFEDPKTICPRGSAYSAATVLADGTLGVYYEEEGVNEGYTMRFVRFSLDWASDHKYAFTVEKPYKRYTSLQAIVNAILRNVYQGVSVGNATNEIKRMNEATAE